MTADLFIHYVKIYYLIAIVFLITGSVIMWLNHDTRMAKFGFGMIFSPLVTVLLVISGVVMPICLPFMLAFGEEESNKGD